jgi:hypothetical protein
MRLGGGERGFGARGLGFNRSNDRVLSLDCQLPKLVSGAGQEVACAAVGPPACPGPEPEQQLYEA